jgi:hypothetical protein
MEGQVRPRLKLVEVAVGVAAVVLAAGTAAALTVVAAPASSTGTSAVALDWQTLAPGPAPAVNPLKGLMPYAGSYSAMPYSLEWFYIPLNAVMTGPDTFDWSALDSQLSAITARGHQAVLRFYLDYPGKPSGVPQYLFNEGLACNSYPDYGNNGESCSPDYSNPDLDEALDQFIAAFGARYDGDPAIAFIELGLLGFWGEWHTYPYNGVAEPENWFASPAEQDRVISDYLAAFHKTKLLVRYPSPCDGCSVAGTDNASDPIGYHDDSFALETDAGSTGFHFMDLMAQAGATSKWQSEPIGGELYPQLQTCIFDEPYDCPSIEAGSDNSIYGANDITESIGQTHVSWLLDQAAFDPGYSGEDLSAAQSASETMGYVFQVTSAAAQWNGGSGILIGAKIQDNGVAPFYYNWPVQVAAVNAQGQVVASGQVPFDLTSVEPGAPQQFTYLLQSSSGFPAGTYSVVMSVPNPLQGGDPVKFANAGQDETLPGWLTLSSVSVGAGASSSGQATASPSGPATASPSVPPTASPSVQPTASPPGSAEPSSSAAVTYLASSPDNVWAGGAGVQACSACSGGTKVGYIGYNGTLTFSDIGEQSAGTYRVVISYVNGGAEREATLTVNGNPVTLDFSGTNNGNWDFVQELTTTLTLDAGANTIEFSDPGGWAPDIASIAVGTSGQATASSSGSQQPSPPAGSTYLASSTDNVLAGGAVVQACSACSGGAKVGYIGNGGTLTFPDVAEQAAGSYRLVIAYVDGGSEREATLTVNGNPVTLDFSGTNDDNWDFVQELVTTVTLPAGASTIEFSNSSGWAPDIADITVS